MSISKTFGALRRGLRSASPRFAGEPAAAPPERVLPAALPVQKHDLEGAMRLRPWDAALVTAQPGLPAVVAR